MSAKATLILLSSFQFVMSALAVSETPADSLARDYAGLPLSAESAVTGAVFPSGAQAAKKSPSQLAWTAYEKSIGAPLRKWASTEVAAEKGGTVFYPFSGPDLVTVAQMFPEADRYVLVAIQPAGSPVELSAMAPAARAAFREKFRGEWAKFGILGFFRTVDLNENTASTTARLTSTPVMMAFAASLGFRVDAVCPIAISAETGDYEPVVPGNSSKWSSVRLELSKEARQVVVDYVCLDLSDDYLNSHNSEVQWLKACAKNPVLLKAASHLLPKPYFSVCRNALVEGATLLVQDETGLEYRDLKKIGDVRLYGRFVEAHKLFDASSQRDLASAYAEKGQIRPLPFSYSYQKAADRRSMQVARRRVGE